MSDDEEKMTVSRGTELAAQLWCEPSTEKCIMDPPIAEAAAAKFDELLAALEWCSGSVDFGEGGQARKGWLKICAPLLGHPDAES